MQQDTAAGSGYEHDDADPFLLLRAFLVLAVGLAFFLGLMAASRNVRTESWADGQPVTKITMSLSQGMLNAMIR